ncbi:uncharacterized protein A1O9_12600 [Exophiala aquamarina CBS 119918]|uniref:YAG7-like dimerisation domain-containing protein n=1 Tax=Exophiala aquamarina CBS 119918 TaxID=1182545 RepID=A0A072P6N0_9EURO|nr:uncharacterized protein A1O9_12600 [Exophiala aquamarina CBS 119918]KEF51250.1 hypothetical protein A1O9_12600 [Exophiala aquamarina CBS 119918]
MSAVAPVPVDSKSAKKRKAKGETAPAPSGAATPPAETVLVDTHTNGMESQTDSQFIKDLTKSAHLPNTTKDYLADFSPRNIRNIHKKLAASTKADTVIAENPGVALDDLVASKKLNADQKAQILKKPALQAQLAQLEDQLAAFRAFAQELEDRFAKDKSSLTEAHEAEIVAVKEKASQETDKIKIGAVEDALRVINHFLHAAASKRQSEDVDSAESRAFEGTLLLVYQGNEASLETLKSLVYGVDEKVPDVSGEVLDYTYAQVKESALRGADDVAQTTNQEEEDSQPTEPKPAASYVPTDSTVANAGLTELNDTTTLPTTNASESESDVLPVPEQSTTGADAANAIAEASWDPQASVVTDTSATNEEWVQVPRDPAETETGLAATPAAVQGTANWAEEVGAAAEEKPTSENDGFEQVKRDRGRGRGGRGGRGDFRGRGRAGGRGDRGGRGGGGPRGARGGPRGDKS